VVPKDGADKEWREQDVWEYYDSVKDEIVPLFKGMNVMIKKIVDTGPIWLRNDPKTGEPIKINTVAEFERFNDGRNVEFHCALPGKETNVAWVDLDPQEGYPDDKTLEVAHFIAENLPEVVSGEPAEVSDSGGRGYHIRVPLSRPTDVDALRKQITAWLDDNVVPKFEGSTTGVTHEKDTIRLDVSTLHAGGSLRCPLSLNAETGDIAGSLQQTASLLRVSFIVHMPGHKNSKGENSPWVIKSHETGKIIGSYKSRPAAERALQMMHVFKHAGLLRRKALMALNPEEVGNNPKFDLQALREAIIAEMDAINLYEQMAADADDEKVRETLLDIAREEKTHVGEFEAILKQLDPQYTQELENGQKEVSASLKVAAFKFDPNSTENEGRFRLRDPKDFDQGTFKRWKTWGGVTAPDGVAFIVGKLKAGSDALQTIRFDKSKYDNKKAGEYWATVKNKPGFGKHWAW
jgi:hypothetical protein